MLPASTGERKQRDVSRGRPDGRTVEIQRLIGRSLRVVVDFEALGERADLRRLRRAPGRRRHPLRLDHRRDGRAAAGVRAARRRGQARALTADRHGRGGLVRDRRRRAAARPRLLRGLDRRGRRERRHDRRRRAGRGPGDRRAHAALARAPRRAARARRGRDRRAARAPGRGGRVRRRGESPRRRRASALVLATRNPHKLREFERLLAPRRDLGRAACRRGSSCRPRTARRSRRTRSPRRAPRPRRPAAPRSPTTRGSRRRRSTAAPGRPLGALRGRRVRATRRTSTSCCARCRRATLLRYVCALAYVDPVSERSGSSSGAAPGAWPRLPRGGGGFGYDPVFVPDEPGDGRTMAELGEPRRTRSATGARGPGAGGVASGRTKPGRTSRSARPRCRSSRTPR